eukprot:570758-Karenia_brevis.AAC.1
MWNRGVQTDVSMSAVKEMATQTEETAMGLKKYAKASLKARSASPQRRRSRTPTRPSQLSTAQSS